MKLYRAIYPYEYELFSQGKEIIKDNFVKKTDYSDESYKKSNFHFNGANSFSKAGGNGIFWFMQSKQLDKPLFPTSVMNGFANDEVSASHMLEWEVSEDALKRMGAHFGAGNYGNINMPEVTVPYYSNQDNIKVTPIEKADRYIVGSSPDYVMNSLDLNKGEPTTGGGQKVKIHPVDNLQDKLFDCYDTPAGATMSSSAPHPSQKLSAQRNFFEEIWGAAKKSPKTGAVALGLLAAGAIAGDIAYNRGANTTQKI